MWLVAALLLAGAGWWFWRRWRRTAPTDPRLTITFWRNSGLVTGAYLLFILLGAGITRIMVGFNRSGYADLLMVAFFGVWVLNGGMWLARVLPSTKGLPRWLVTSRGWLDAAALVALAALATGARML